ncbi:unnamed protein product [Rotaria sordida]|uniref:EGF-like domain-containing protein n=1 Tax=Rotaria sordida TaxID=392033 RepID=A0A814N5J3_9BILA|nr:unnamed protein product [Rotaria sordida]
MVEHYFLKECSTTNASQCHDATLYRCDNSSKCISRRRLVDGIQDCIGNDDEILAGTCSLNDKFRFRCSENENKCISALLINDGYQDCKFNEDESKSALTDNQSQWDISFPSICDGFRELIPIEIDGHNETDETECIAESHDQILYAQTFDCNLINFNIYLLYRSRPKDITKNYSIQIHVHDKQSLEYRGSWLFSLAYTFLPVHRMALKITISPNRPVRCSFACNYHGECMKYMNKNDDNLSFYCRCDPGWLGKYCTIQHDTCYLCAHDSLCYDNPTSLQYDCLDYYVEEDIVSYNNPEPLAYQLIAYCIRLEDRSELSETLPAKHLIKGRSFTFIDLNNQNITGEQLLDWAATIELVERYEAYLVGDSTTNGSDLYYNCTNDWFGNACEYSFYQAKDKRTLIDVVYYTFNEKEFASPEHVSCYKLLDCKRGPSALCLDWREICDGKIDCLNNGIDEENCWQLENSNAFINSTNEFLCHNGMQSISRSFYRNGLYNPDCIDRTDEVHNVEYWENCFRDPAFRCEEHTCHPGLGEARLNCSDGECVDDLYKCTNQRGVINTAEWALLDISELCWNGMVCLTKMKKYIGDETCGLYCYGECAINVKIDCKPIFRFPTDFIALNHVFLLYMKESADEENERILPSYICYDPQQCSIALPSVNMSLVQHKSSCVNFEKFGFQYEYQPTLLELIVMIEHYFISECATTSTSQCHDVSLYQCINSSKCISKRRLVDGIQDCISNDDELFADSCLLNDTFRFQCSEKENKCISPILINDGRSNCEFDEDESRSALLDYRSQTDISFPNICDGFRELIPIKINNLYETDETECEFWYCNNFYTGCDHIWHCPTEKQQCLCPPSYYGHLCQYQNQRVSLTLKIVNDADWRTVFNIVTMLIDNEGTIQSHDQILYVQKFDCNLVNFNIYLLYRSRPKDIMKNYSIQIHVYDKQTLEYRGSWLFPLVYTFLPVHRMAIEITISSYRPLRCSFACNHHGECVKYINHNDENSLYYCRCNPGWSGKDCTIKHDTCNLCARDSLCMYPNICVCPLGKEGPRCYLKSTTCSSPLGRCQNGGLCIPSDMRRRKNYIYCLCPEGFSNGICSELDLKIRIEFHSNIEIPQSTIIYLIQNTIMTTNKPVSIYKKIPFDQNSISFYTPNRFFLAFMALSINEYYLTYTIHDNNPLMNENNRSTILMRVQLDRRCRHVRELLNRTLMSLPLLRRIKYYQLPCKQRWNLACFYDEKYMCYCMNRNESREAQCFTMGHNEMNSCQGISNGGCLNGARCFQDQLICPTMVTCVCAECFYGKHCQFTTQGFGLSLDAILGYQIQSNVSFLRQPLVIKETIDPYPRMQ